MSKRLLYISPDLSLPIDAVTSTTVVYGGKGMGKTNFGRVLLEECAKVGVRWSLLDPMGVAWGLRHSADGKRPGIECLILGGAHGDIPIEPTGGAIVADLVADHDVSVIIDISRKTNGDMWGVAERIRFVTDYGRQLYKRQGGLIQGRRRAPILQVIDEAARFLPQTIRQGDQDAAQCESAWSTIVEEGRNVGIGVVLLTQRSARLNKNVAELADLMLAFRTVGPNSLRAVLDWLGEHVEKDRLKELSGKVRSLPRGSALAVSPGWLNVEKVIRIRLADTFDSSKTPKAGEASVRVKGDGAKPDLQLYAQRMQETIDRAKAEDPAALRKRIAQLEKAAAAKPTSIPPVTTAETKSKDREKIRMLTDQLRAAHKTAGVYEKSMASIYKLADELAGVADRLRAQVDGARGEAAEAAATVSAPIPPDSAPARAAAPAVRPVPVPKPAATPTSGDGELGGPERRILAAIAWWHAIGVRPVDHSAVALLAGYGSADSSGYRNPRSRLNTMGLVALSDGRIQLTDAGNEVADLPDIEQSNDGVQSAILSKLTGPEVRILKPLIDAYPNGLTHAQAAEAAGYNSPDSSGYRNPRSRLNTCGLIRLVNGTVYAADLLFPRGA